MHLNTLGGLALEGAGFKRQKPLLLLAYLALEGARDRRFLAELFWMGSPDPRNNLGTAIAQLRKGAPRAIEADKERTWTTVVSDAQELLTAVEEGAFDQALELYRGPFLKGVDPGDSSVELEEWVYGTREYLANRVRDALIKLAEIEAAQGNFKEAADLAERAYFLSGAAEPEPEELGHIHTLLVAGGSPRAGEVRKEAVSFGITLEIDDETARSMLAGRPEVERINASRLPEVGASFVGRNAELLELNELLATDEVRLLTLAAPGGAGKSRLALQLARYQQGNDRFPDGVFFVPLETVMDPSMIPSSIATGVGLTLQGTVEPLVQVVRFVGEKRKLLVLDNFEHLLDGAKIVSELVLACPKLKVLVTSRERLNLVEESVFPLEGLVSPRSYDAPQLEMQYREAIELFGKRAKSANLRFSLTPEVMPDVLRICELVGGSPLGIELAAAWVRMMPIEEIAKEVAGDLDFLASPLRNVSERQKSLRVVFEHSWNLLTPSEQMALRKLSVFRGGFRREAAAAVAGASIPVLASLTDKSLLSVLPSGRYDRHPLVFQYTEEKLEEHPDEKSEAQAQHAGYFLALVEAGESKFRTAEEKAWLRQLDEEFDNIRTALRWAQESEEIELGLRLGAALHWYWRVRGHIQEGLRWVQAALSHPAASGRTAARANALNLASNLIHRLGDFAGGAPLSEESVDIWRELGDDGGLALALFLHGNNVWRLGDPVAGRSLLEESVARARKVGDTRNLPQILGNLAALLDEIGERDQANLLNEELTAIARATGNTTLLIRAHIHRLGPRAMNEGNYDLAHSHFEEGLSLARSMGDEEAIPEILWPQGELSYRVSDYPAARSLCEESLRLIQEQGNMHAISSALSTLGEILLIQGEVDNARTRFEEISAIGRETGREAGVAEALIKLGRIHLVEGDLPRARSSFEEGLARARKLSLSALIAQALIGLGGVAYAEQEFSEAHSQFEESLAIMKELGDKRGVAKALSGLGLVASEEGGEVSAHARFFESLEIHQALDDKHGIAGVLEGLARLAPQEDPLRAAHLWGAAELVRETIGAPLVLEERRRYEREVAKVREGVDETAFSSAWRDGKEMSLQEAIDLAIVKQLPSR